MRNHRVIAQRPNIRVGFRIQIIRSVTLIRWEIEKLNFVTPAFEIQMPLNSCFSMLIGFYVDLGPTLALPFLLLSTRVQEESFIPSSFPGGSVTGTCKMLLKENK